MQVLNKSIKSTWIPNQQTVNNFSPAVPNKVLSTVSSGASFTVNSPTNSVQQTYTVQSIMKTGGAYIVYNTGTDVNRMWSLDEGVKTRIDTLLNSLDITDKNDFYNDVLHASFKAVESNSIQPINDVLEAWDATAEILFDSALMDDIQQADSDFDNGETVEWHPGIE